MLNNVCNKLATSWRQASISIGVKVIVIPACVNVSIKGWEREIRLSWWILLAYKCHIHWKEILSGQGADFITFPMMVITSTPLQFKLKVWSCILDKWVGPPYRFLFDLWTCKTYMQACIADHLVNRHHRSVSCMNNFIKACSTLNQVLLHWLFSRRLK